MAHRSFQIIRRRLFTIFAAISLFLFLATPAVWIRAQFAGEELSLCCARSSWALEACTSHLVFGHRRSPWYKLGLSWAQDHPWPSESPFWEVRFERFGPSMGYDSAALLWVPYPLVLLLTAPLAVMGLLRVRRSLRRHRLGLCPTCGYDLRATPDRCPECGAFSHRVTESTESTEKTIA